MPTLIDKWLRGVNMVNIEVQFDESSLVGVRVGGTTPKHLTFSQKCTVYLCNHNSNLIEMKIHLQHLHGV